MVDGPDETSVSSLGFNFRRHRQLTISITNISRSIIAIDIKRRGKGRGGKREEGRREKRKKEVL